MTICDECPPEVRAWPMKRCEFQGGLELEEKYRSSLPCLVEFEPSSPNAKYCENCAPFAKKWLSAQNANARYRAEPEKYAKITRENRWKRKKAVGRACRRIGSMQRCEYRDKRGRRGVGCEIKYKLRSSAQRYCDPCQLHADADRAQEHRDTHHDELLLIYRARGKTLRNGAGLGKLLLAIIKMKEPAGRAALNLLRNPKASRADLLKAAGEKLSPATLTRIRDIGRRAKKLQSSMLK
jgi:hypothetical protein